MDKFEEAVVWIVGLLRENKINFQVTGGVAAKIYGSNRKVLDIDILIHEEDFDKLVPLVKEHIVEGPMEKQTEMLECMFMKIKYNGILIEFGGSEKSKIFDKKFKKWIPLDISLSRYVNKTVFGIVVPLMPRDELVKYKEKLGRKVDLLDISNLK